MDVVERENAELDSLTVVELEDELATLASHIYAGTCRWLELVAELDRRGQPAGCSCAEWLAWRCGLTPRTAREHVRIARRLGDLPRIGAAFRGGVLSYAKVRALTRIAEPETEEELLQLALNLTAAQLERAVRAYRRVTTEEAAAVQSAAYVDWYWDEDGSLVLRGRLAPEDGAVLLQALDAAREALRARGQGTEGGSAEPRPTNAEALAAVADSALSSGSAGRSGGERAQVVVHVDQAALSNPDEGGCEIADGPAIAAETARRLACDSSVVHVSERAVGRFRSDERRARSRRHYGERSRGATAVAASPGAKISSSSTRITSVTGLTEARPHSATCFCSAAVTTGSSTRAATRSSAYPATACASETPGAGRSPTHRGRHRGASTASGKGISRS